MLFKFGKRKNSIDLTKHGLSRLVLFHKKPVFILILGIFWCISWVWLIGEVFVANNHKPDFVFATNKLNEPVNSVFVFNEGWVNDFSNGAVFISQSCQFVFKCSFKVGSSLVELLSPVSAFAEDVGKPGSKESSYNTQEKSSDETFKVHLLSVLIGYAMGLISCGVGIFNYYRFYS